MRRRLSSSTALALLLCAFVDPACHEASEAASMRASKVADVPAIAPSQPPVAPEPQPMAPAGDARPSSITQPDRADRSSANDDRITLVEQAKTTVAYGIGEGLGAAKRLLSAPATNASPPRVPMTLEPTKPRRPTTTTEAPPSGKTPLGPTSTKSCEIETYRWKNARVPLSDEERKTVRLKNGSWDGSSEDACHWVTLTKGPVFSDLNEDGRKEAYLVIGETLASMDTEGTCSLGMSDMSETLLVFELDEACKPRRIGMVDDAGQCEFGSGVCESLELRIQGQHVDYGRKRFGWSGDSFQRTK